MPSARCEKKKDERLLVLVCLHVENYPQPPDRVLTLISSREACYESAD